MPVWIHDKHERLKALAKSNSISINKLMDELGVGGVQPRVNTTCVASGVLTCSLTR